MDPKRSLFIGTVLLIVFAGIWILTQLIPQMSVVFVIGLLVALAGFVALLFWQRSLTGTDRTLAMSGAIGTLAWFGAVLVLALLANPITFEGDPGERTGINESPPEFLTATSNIVLNLLPLVIVVGSVIALWPAWSTRERSLGAVGAATLAILTIPPLMGAGFSTMVGTILFGIALIAWTLALVLPVAMPRAHGNEWAEPHTAE